MVDRQTWFGSEHFSVNGCLVKTMENKLLLQSQESQGNYLSYIIYIGV